MQAGEVLALRSKEPPARLQPAPSPAASSCSVTLPGLPVSRIAVIPAE